MLLSDTKIRKALIKDKQYKLKDGEGLYLLVHPNGSKYWRLRYTRKGKESMKALGKYPETSLIEARIKRAEARKHIREGRSSLNFKKLATEWHNKNLAKWIPEHAVVIMNRLENHILPYLGDLDALSIKPMIILDALRKMEAADKVHTAKRVAQYCVSIFQYGIITGRLDTNPAIGLASALKSYKSKHLPTIKSTEIKTLLERLNKSKASVVSVIATKLSLLLFIRQGELRKAEWKHIDLDKAIWTFPAANMKMRREHIVPLSKQAIKLLKELQEVTGADKYVFHSLSKTGYMSENTVNKLLHQLGYKDKLVAHGFRALASTSLNEHGFKPEIIEKQLAHEEPNKVKAAYNRAEYMEERVVMMSWWSDFVGKQGSL